MPLQIGQRPDHGFDEPLGLLSDCHRRIEHFLGVLATITDEAAGGPLTPSDRRALEGSSDTSPWPRLSTLPMRKSASFQGYARTPIQRSQPRWRRWTPLNTTTRKLSLPRGCRRAGSTVARGWQPLRAESRETQAADRASAGAYQRHIAIEDREYFRSPRESFTVRRSKNSAARWPRAGKRASIFRTKADLAWGYPNCSPSGGEMSHSGEGRLSSEPSTRRTARTASFQSSSRLRRVLEMRRDSPAGVPFRHPRACLVTRFLGQRVGNVRRAWQTAVLRAHGYKPAWIWKKKSGPTAEGSTRLSPESEAPYRAINLHFQDLRHEGGSRLLEGRMARAPRAAHARSRVAPADEHVPQRDAPRTARVNADLDNPAPLANRCKRARPRPPACCKQAPVRNGNPLLH